MSISLSESEDTIRNLKASESVVGAFQASGIPSPPADLAAIVTTYVKNATMGIATREIANMQPGSGSLGTAATAGVNLFLGSMTPTQIEAMRAGVNPLDSAAVLKFRADLMSHLPVGRMAASMATGSGGRASSATYTEALSGGSTTKTLLGEGYSMVDVQYAMHFAHEINVNERYAEFFAGASRDSMSAVRDYIKDGKAITDDKIHDMKDVKLVMGAIRAGKIKPDDPKLPPSIKKIIADMKKDGVDPATADVKDIKKYLKEHPETIQHNLRTFREEMHDLKATAPIILAFGRNAHEILSANLNKNEYLKLIKLTHYSHHIGKEAYKEAVFKEIESQ